MVTPTPTHTAAEAVAGRVAIDTAARAAVVKREILSIFNPPLTMGIPFNRDGYSMDCQARVSIAKGTCLTG